MADLAYSILYAGVPFVTDAGRLIRMDMRHSPLEAEEQLPPRKHQPLADLIDEIDRLIPFRYAEDFLPSPDFPGRNLAGLARRAPARGWPNPNVPVGTWYYPNTASRWSVFRGLATSRMVRAMLDATRGSKPALFSMGVDPITPGKVGGFKNDPYTVSSQMYLLPPRPLAEHGGQFDGLYLVTLVDERWYWQFSNATLHPDEATTWGDLVEVLTQDLGITLTFPVLPPAAYTRPEPDSPLWANEESGAALLDAVALNLGCVVVRALDGAYNLMQPAFSRGVAARNRKFLGARAAGGDYFASGSLLPAGDLQGAANAVLPTHVEVTFPKYVAGDDPVPHFLNPRYAPRRPSAWNEDSYGATWSVFVPLLSGGLQFSGQLAVFISGSLQLGASGPFVSSGLTGTPGYIPTVQDDAKAVYATEAGALGSPLNASGLTSLAMQLAYDQFTQQVAGALDEAYPGTYFWEPEGIHDVIWTWSARSRLASTRVVRAPWNAALARTHHATPAVSGYAASQPGLGGRSVAQTVRDSHPGGVQTSLFQTMASGDSQVTLEDQSFFPTQNRWHGRVDAEVILFEGTSGGADVDVVYRGVEGTLQAEHGNGAAVTMVVPNATPGVNLSTYEKAAYVYPQEWTSGGIRGVNVVPPLQSVLCETHEPVVLLGADHFAGNVLLYDQTAADFDAREAIWLVERNDMKLVSGRVYDGQLAGYSAVTEEAPASRPVYLVTEASPMGGDANCPDCDPQTWAETDVRCEDEVLNVYTRTVTLTTEDCCPVISRGDWAFDHQAGCCECTDVPDADAGCLLLAGCQASQPFCLSVDDPGVNPEGSPTCPGLLDDLTLNVTDPGLDCYNIGSTIHLFSCGDGKWSGSGGSSCGMLQVEIFLACAGGKYWAWFKCAGVGPIVACAVEDAGLGTHRLVGSVSWPAIGDCGAFAFSFTITE